MHAFSIYGNKKVLTNLLGSITGFIGFVMDGGFAMFGLTKV